MNQKPQRPELPKRPPNRSEAQVQISKKENNQVGENLESITDKMINQIVSRHNLQDYPIRALVEHTKEFGSFLKDNKLETNQIRKFLDAINRAKDKLIALESDNELQSIENDDERANAKFARIESELIFLKPKLFYAAARQSSAEPFRKVISEAIDRVHNLADFRRLIELIEATVAYHTYHKQTNHNKGRK